MRTEPSKTVALWAASLLLAAPPASAQTLTVQDWHDTQRVVLDGAFFCTQARSIC